MSTRAKIAVVLATFSLAVSPFLYAIHAKPGAVDKNGATRMANMASSVEVTRGQRGKYEIALTFDGGAEAECFDDLIKALANAHVHSSFFITGRFANEHSDCAAAITRLGHEIGNTPGAILALTEESAAIIRHKLTHAEQRIVEVSGQNPKPRWRAPYGDCDARVLKVTANLGYRSIYGTLDSLDGVQPKKTPQFLTDRITSKSDSDLDGAIILMHVGERSTAGALPAIIANLQARGFNWLPSQNFCNENLINIIVPHAQTPTAYSCDSGSDRFLGLFTNGSTVRDQIR